MPDFEKLMQQKDELSLKNSLEEQKLLRDEIRHRRKGLHKSWTDKVRDFRRAEDLKYLGNAAFRIK